MIETRIFNVFVAFFHCFYCCSFGSTYVYYTHSYNRISHRDVSLCVSASFIRRPYNTYHILVCLFIHFDQVGKNIDVDNGKRSRFSMYLCVVFFFLLCVYCDYVLVTVKFDVFQCLRQLKSPIKSKLRVDFYVPFTQHSSL